MTDEPEKKANSPNDEEIIDLELPKDEIEFISDFIDFDAGSINDPSLEKTEELRVLKNGKPYTADELDIFGDRMFSLFRPTGQDIEDWIEHGYTDFLSKRVYPNYEKYINSRKEAGEDVQEDEAKLDYMKKQSKYNLRHKLNNPWEMSDEEKRHFNGRVNGITQLFNKKDALKPLDDKELNELVNGIYNAKLKAGKIHADFNNLSEEKRNAFEEEYKSHIKLYFRNLQENGMTKLVRNSHNIFASEGTVAKFLQGRIIKNWQKDASEMNFTDDICKALAIPTKSIDDGQEFDFDNELETVALSGEQEVLETNSTSITETTETVENKKDDIAKDEVVIKEKLEGDKSDTDDNLRKDHPDTQTLTKVDENSNQDKYLDFGDAVLENPEKAMSIIEKEKQLQSRYQPGEKVVITKDNGEQQEDTVSKVEQPDLNSSPTIHTETGQTLKEEDSKVKEQESVPDPEVKHQENYLSDREYVQKIEEQNQMGIAANKIRTASNTIANAFREFKDYDESKDPLENMKNLIEFVGYDTTGVLKQNQAGVNYMSVKIDDGTVFDYVISKDISTKEKFKQSLYDTNKRSNELAKQTNKNAEKEVKRLSRERLEASEYRRTQSSNTQNQSQKQNSGISMN